MVWIRGPPAVGRRIGRRSCARIGRGLRLILDLSRQHVEQLNLRMI
jgi:hypothetical protein